VTCHIQNLVVFATLGLLPTSAPGFVFQFSIIGYSHLDCLRGANDLFLRFELLLIVFKLAWLLQFAMLLSLISWLISLPFRMLFLLLDSILWVLALPFRILLILLQWTLWLLTLPFRMLLSLLGFGPAGPVKGVNDPTLRCCY
jgi:hypothetical protein